MLRYVGTPHRHPLEHVHAQPWPEFWRCNGWTWSGAFNTSFWMKLRDLEIQSCRGWIGIPKLVKRSWSISLPASKNSPSNKGNATNPRASMSIISDKIASTMTSSPSYEPQVHMVQWYPIKWRRHGIIKHQAIMDRQVLLTSPYNPLKMSSTNTKRLNWGQRFTCIPFKLPTKKNTSNENYPGISWNTPSIH